MPLWIFFLPLCAEYPLFTIPSESFFCMIKWTFVRINYHYMGLPFLCMQGSLRITGRLLHIFFSNPLHQICLYLFPSAVFGKALSLHWPGDLSKTTVPQSVCMRIIFPSYYGHWSIITFFLQKNKTQRTLRVHKFPRGWRTAACSLCPYVSYNTWLNFPVTNAKVTFQGHYNYMMWIYRWLPGLGFLHWTRPYILGILLQTWLTTMHGNDLRWMSFCEATTGMGHGNGIKDLRVVLESLFILFFIFRLPPLLQLN